MATNMFLKVKGVEGESQDDKHAESMCSLSVGVRFNRVPDIWGRAVRREKP
jgi:hypothetical protein